MTHSSTEPTAGVPSGAMSVSETISSAEAVRIFLRLKFRLLARNSGTAGGFLDMVGITLTVISTLLASLGIILMRGNIAAPSVVVVGMASLSILWTAFALLMGGERHFNPGPFTLLPLSTSKLLLGFLVSACLGLSGLAAAVVSFSVLSHANSLLTAGVLTVSAFIFWVTLIMAARVTVAASALLQRRRRGRDLVIFVASCAGITIAVSFQFIVSLAEWVSVENLESARRVLRWVPWAWAPEAMAAAIEGRLLDAAGWLFPAIGLPVVLFRLWQVLMDRVLSLPPQQASTLSSKSLVRRYLPKSLNPSLAAAFSRTVLQIRRDPRELIAFAGFLPLIIVAGIPFVGILRDGDDRLVLTTVVWGSALGLLVANLFGADGRTTSVDLLVARDLRSVLVGKAFVRLGLFSPVIVLFAVTVAALTNGWRFFPTAIVLAGAITIASVSLGMVASVRFPYPMPDGLGYNANNMSNSLLPIIMVLVMSLAVPLILAPVLVPSLLASIFWSAPIGFGIALVGIPYSYVLFAICSKRSTSWLVGHQPEFLAALSRSAN